MLTARCRGDRLVELVLPDPYDLYSCQVFYSVDGVLWNTASLYEEIDAIHVLEGSDNLWNQAQTLGIVRLKGKRTNVVYWNPYLNVGGYCGPVTLKLQFIAESGLYEESVGFVLEDGGVVYVDCGQVLPERVVLPVEGEYDVYFGLPDGGTRFIVRMVDEPFERVVTPGNSMDLMLCSYEKKANKEIWWKSVSARNGHLEFRPLLETVKEHYHAGKLSYIKLVPVGRSAGEQRFGCMPEPAFELTRNVVMYYEPYSYSLHGFHDAESMNGIMLEEFMRCRPKEISIQTVRIGSKSLHHSAFLEKHNLPSLTDERTIIDDPVKLAENCDILRETIAYARGSGIRITANIGMNRPYLFIPTLSDSFTRDHPDLIVDGDFDYTRPEVQRYALRIIEELIMDYDIDGLFLDYMRHYLNQTADTLVYVISASKQMLERKGKLCGKKLDLKVRVPADHPVYYEALAACVAGGWVDGIVPSNTVTTRPLPPVGHYARLCAGTSVQVYGCIDGWLAHLGSDSRAGNLMVAHTPADVVDVAAEYTAAGTDGFFIYQADQFTGNPYLNKFFVKGRT